MACTRIGCGGGVLGNRRNSDLLNPQIQNARPPMASLMTADRHLHRDNQISTPSSYLAEVAMKTSFSSAYAIQEQKLLPTKMRNNRRAEGEEEADHNVMTGREKLDKWIRDSVAEIVKKLPEAPLLVHVYSGKNGTVKTKAEKAEDWSVVKGKWEKEDAELPEGMIFVEQLEDTKDVIVDDQNRDYRHDDGGGGDGGLTREWGIVVQGKGVGCAPVCYLLKTSRVGGGSCMGMFCTHFCLVRVNSFWESSKSQLSNCWLVQGMENWSPN